jgi:hypothetical protein
MIFEVIVMWREIGMGACTMLALSACATTQTQPTASAQRPPVGCVSDTATHLPVRPNECAGAGSTYTKEDMDRTGQVYVQDALRMLDPTVTVHGP